MKIVEGQKKQFIVLCCLILLVVAFGVYKVVGVGTHAEPRQEQPAVTEEPAKSSVQDRAQGDGRTDGGAVAAPTIVAVQAARDPFVPQVGPAEGQSASASSTARSMPPLIANADLPFSGPLIPPMPFGGGIEVTGAASTERQTDPAHELRLTGVIRGAVNVAIIRGPDNTRYIVKEGQTIDGKYLVESIWRYGIRLRFENKKYVLPLGGSDGTQHGARA